jgi:uncharacterized coiled-coil protein SlyX
MLKHILLSSDAVPIVKAMREQCPDAKNEDIVFQFVDEQILTTSLKRMFSRANLESGNKIVRFHNLRKYLIDRLSAVCAESRWKQIIGKHISEGAYVSYEQLREVYTRAMPSIIINGAKNHAKIEALEDAIATQQKELASKDEIIRALEKKLGCVTTETANNSTTIEDLARQLRELRDSMNKKTE